MIRTTVILLALAFWPAASLRAQEAEVVADILQLDVSLAYGGGTPYLSTLPPEARECELRHETGLVMRLSRRPLYANISTGIGYEAGTLQIFWTPDPNPGRKGFILKWEERTGWGSMSSSQTWDSTTELWNSGSSIRVERDPNQWRPQAATGQARILYLILVPRADPRFPGLGADLPRLPDEPTIDDFIRLATEHHARSGQGASRELLADLARFIPIEELPRRSLEDLLDPQVLRSEVENFRANRRGRRGRSRVVRGGWDHSEDYRKHQALLRAGHEAPPPQFKNPFMGRENYAVYRQMIDAGFLKGRPGIETMELLLEVSSDTGAHRDFIARLENDDFAGADEDARRSLINRLSRDLASRDPLDLALLALGNLLGLAVLILAIRIFCRRLLFA